MKTEIVKILRFEQPFFLEAIQQLELVDAGQVNKPGQGRVFAAQVRGQVAAGLFQLAQAELVAGFIVELVTAGQWTQAVDRAAPFAGFAELESDIAHHLIGERRLGVAEEIHQGVPARFAGLHIATSQAGNPFAAGAVDPVEMVAEDLGQPPGRLALAFPTEGGQQQLGRAAMAAEGAEGDFADLVIVVIEQLHQ